MSTSEIDHIINHLSLKKSRRRWRITAIIAVAAALFTFAAAAGWEKSMGPHVARLTVDGLITGDERQLQLIRDLGEDENVRAMIVRIDSPGGTTVGSEALYEELRSFAKIKPVVAVMDSVAASGGYITALAADRIYARGNTITGSIGVIFSYPDASQLLGTVGVKMEEVKSGDLKAVPSGYAPVPEKARIVMQDMVNDGFAWFKGLVRERRSLDSGTVDRLSDGRVYSGRQALAEKLIDELGTEVEARAWLASDKKVEAILETITREPKPGPNRSWFDSLLGHASAKRLAEASGLGGLLLRAERAQLDGLLVLWHPAL